MDTHKTLKEISALCPIDNGFYSVEYSYKSFKDFLSYSPHRIWPGFIIDSYKWTANDDLYIYYKKCDESNILMGRHDRRHIKCPVSNEEDNQIRIWLRENMCVLWKLL